LKDSCFFTQHWNETIQKQDGTIRRETRFPEGPESCVLSGPHFHVLSPYFQTPKRICTTHRAYDQLDMTDLPISYLPRVNYQPACEAKEYQQRTPTTTWGEKVTTHFRYAHREMVGVSGERTLLPCILPKGVGYIHTVLGIVFKDTSDLLSYAASASSIPIDYRVRSTGTGHINKSLADQFPLFTGSPRSSHLFIRALSLNCLTTHYAELWFAAWDIAYNSDTWTKSELRLDNAYFAKLTPEWNRNSALRTPFERRQALVELDVLAARELKLSLDQLLDIYRIQFPVLRQYEADTWYDQKGRIIFTVNKSLSGVGLPRNGTPRQHIVGWEDVRDMASGTVSQTIMDDTLPGGPYEKTIVYHAPFTRCSREDDYRTAWTEFERRGL
jgi:hypothetical protein